MNSIKNQRYRGIIMKKFARKCDECGEVFNEGFCIEGGETYYCSKECILNNMSKKEWKEMYDNGNSYWTSWEDPEEYEYYEDGTEID